MSPDLDVRGPTPRGAPMVHTAPGWVPAGSRGLPPAADSQTLAMSADSYVTLRLEILACGPTPSIALAGRASFVPTDWGGA